MANLSTSSLDFIAMVSIETKIVPPLISKSLFYSTHPIFYNFQPTLFLDNVIPIVHIHILMEWLPLAIGSIWDYFHAAAR